jgi:toxin-antitoxin system PIN domain toxin
MMSLDTNLLFYTFAEDCLEHQPAASWLASIHLRDDVVISEFVLFEFYNLLRNPAVLSDPLDAPDAAAVVRTYRAHPRWRLSTFPVAARQVHDEIWAFAARPGIARRRVFDARLALCLRHEGVREFATVNAKDFSDFSFDRVWNPLGQ